MTSLQRLLVVCEGEAQVAWIEPSPLDLPDRLHGLVTYGDGLTVVCPTISAVLYGSRVGRVVVCAGTEPGFCAGLMLAETVRRMGLPEGICSGRGIRDAPERAWPHI